MGANAARRLTVGAAALVLLVSAGPGTAVATPSRAAAAQTSGDWAQVGYDGARRGFNPLETVLGAGNVVGLQQVWSAPGGGCDALCPPAPDPVVSGGRLFVGSSIEGKPFEALDPQTGALLWSRQLGNGVDAGAAVSGGFVYVMTTQTLYALDVKTGADRWTFSFVGALSANWSSPAVVNGIVYADGADPTFALYALDARTGAVRWSVPGAGSVYNPPTVARGVVLQPRNGAIGAFDAATGAPLWTFDGGDDLGFNSVAVSGGKVFAGWGDGMLRALDLATGLPLWTVDTHGTIFTSPAVANGVVYIPIWKTDRDHRVTVLLARRASSGGFLWRVQTDCCHGLPDGGSPTVANGVLYFTAQGGLQAYDAKTGAALLATPAVGCSPDEAVVGDAHVYTACEGNVVRAYGLP